MDIDMDMELWFIEKIEFMKVNGLTIREKARAWKDIQMEINMKESTMESG
jgi:hypothetical protein